MDYRAKKTAKPTAASEAVWRGAASMYLFVPVVTGSLLFASDTMASDSDSENFDLDAISYASADSDSDSDGYAPKTKVGCPLVFWIIFLPPPLGSERKGSGVRKA